MRARVPTYHGEESRVTLLELCRRLRRSATDAETLLWRLLRDRQVAGAKFRRQHQFGPYILDFYCHERSLVVEVDGGQHAWPAGSRADGKRSAYLENHGMRVLRFSDRDVLLETESVLQTIWDEVAKPSPLPSPRGRGEAQGSPQ